MSDTAAPPSVVDLDAFVTQHYALVVSSVRRICGPGVDAEDAVQDALVKLLHRTAKDAPIESVPAWVTVVAANGARTTLRRKGTEAKALERLPRPDGNGPGDADGRIDLDRALALLPERQRTVATLHYVLDASVATIARSMGISEGTVKTQLSRARASLTISLAPKDQAS